MDTTSSDSQVLVVGAGPTGLVLAAQLLARGIRTRTIDKGVGAVPQSRALGVQARTLEVFDVMGLADAFVERGHRVRRFRVYSGQRNLFVLDFARNGSPYGFALVLPQHETEMLLRTRVRELGGIVEQGVELVRAAEDGSAVNATIRDLAGVDTETGPAGPATWWVATARTAGYVTNSGWLSMGSPMHRTGCWQTSPWMELVARTRYTCSSARTACLLPAFLWVSNAGES